MRAFFTIMYAASPDTSGPVMYPAAVAMLCIALFSRMVKSLTPSLLRALNTANARMTLVSPTPSVQPVLAPMYKFVAESNPPRMNPVMADRSVSCGILPRYTLASHHRSFSIGDML